jgi:hypothetical protein
MAGQPPLLPHIPIPEAAPPVYGPGAPVPAAMVPPKRGPQEFSVYHDSAIPLWTQWDVPSALNALDNHSLGQFYGSSLLTDAMGIDDALDAVVQTRVLGLISRPLELTASRRGNGRKARIALKVIRDRWNEIFPDDVLSGLMQAYLMMGFAPAQLVWREDDGLWIPQVQTWHTSTVYFDVPTRHYVANTMEGPVYLAPGDGRWILLTPFGSYRGWMRGAVRSVVIPFLARQYALRDWARYNEVHGLPIKKAKVPSKADGDDKQLFLDTIANLGNESTVLLPQAVGDKDGSSSYDVDLLEAKADTYGAFKDLVSKCEERMAIRLLGQNLTTQIDAGSFAAANVHDRVRLDYVRFDAKALGAIRDQVLRAFCVFNFGDGDLAPDVTWKVTPPEDSQARSAALADMSAALLNFANVKAPIDMRKLLDRADVPLVDHVEGEPLTPTVVAPKPGADGQPPKVVKPPAVPAPEKKETARLSFAQRNAALLADLKDMRDLDLDVTDESIASLAKRHGVPAPKKKNA